MKNSSIRTVLIAFLLMCTFQLKAQFHFGVSPGLQLNGAVFGYQIKKFVPYLGIQMMSGSSDFTEKGKEFDPNTGSIVSYENKFKVSGTVIMPTIGVKYFFMETNKLKAYGNIGFTKFLLKGQIDDTNNPGVNIDLQKVIKGIGIIGAQVGFGTEYFFDDNFSIGGEFGLRLVHLNSKNEFDETVFDPSTGNDVSTTRTDNLKLNFNPTYTKFSLNYYFGK